ncbi:MAG: DUF559 domain-containing protein [Bacteroidetes bacterium]|jgi:very-short-patch-repair endonuclease|nr:DUF559 domain-containing protein [Bacteroidota bacterium]
MNNLINNTYKPGFRPLSANATDISAKAEVFLWQFLQKNKIGGYTFNRQMPIGKYTIDFFCYDLLLGIILEDNPSATDTLENKEKKNYLTELGLHILYFQSREILHQLPKVIATLEKFVSKYEIAHHTNLLVR